MSENPIRKIDHIGVAVRSVEDALTLWRDAFGLELLEVRDIPERGLRIAFLQLGEVMIELLAPLAEGSQVSSFLDKRGEGIHHICVEVGDIREKMASLAAAGVRVLAEEPEIGAEGCPVAFLHPKSTRGVLLELIEK